MEPDYALLAELMKQFDIKRLEVPGKLILERDPAGAVVLNDHNADWEDM